MEKENRTISNMKEALQSYKEQFGEDFTIHDLLLLRDVQAKEKLVNAIYQFPKRLQKQLDCSGICVGLNEIAESIDDIWVTIELYLEDLEREKAALAKGKDDDAGEKQ